ncbi:AraC-like DNA-binding protein [Altererythrobacter atlanticus]|uniref:Helix-turn-helix domain protein n=1 Tax=Croceibacterium atlanticum TaxID=1267766 RepID=A0A0F7KSR8_9SPHN|nr:helix-turn-helix domain-containing protein [Croceibacterium atlanticum]AKH43453.1 Helix-turn-helix domain protein [Croceibacterium atlanticum]MBB5731839.1 AraC-like DNA-binding protein [Croceibacterium atlanticum]
MAEDFSINIQFYTLSEELQPYFTALYLFDITCPEGEYVQDCLHPEWAAMRFSEGVPPIGAVGSAPLKTQWPFVVSGPTSQPIHFRLLTSRTWGLGVLPAGWAKFVDGSARDFADRTVDGSGEAAFSIFTPILDIVRGVNAPQDEVAERINAYLMHHVGRPARHVRRVRACHDLMRDPGLRTVSELGERLGISSRSLERLCARYFGFPPKLMLRRQRFIRSLAQFMLNGHHSWSEAIDDQYHDQSQFVRDFRSFMGMTPSEYADSPHPIIERIMSQRMADQGAAPRTDLPTILRYRPDGLRHGL